MFSRYVFYSLLAGVVSGSGCVAGSCYEELDEAQLLQVNKLQPASHASPKKRPRWQGFPIPPLVALTSETATMLASDFLPDEIYPPLGVQKRGVEGRSMNALCPMFCLARPNNSNAQVMLEDLDRAGYDEGLFWGAAASTLALQRPDLFTFTNLSEGGKYWNSTDWGRLIGQVQDYKEGGLPPYYYNFNAAGGGAQPTATLWISNLKKVRRAVGQCLRRNGHQSISYAQTVQLKFYLLRLAGVSDEEYDEIPGGLGSGFSLRNQLQVRLNQSFVRAGGDLTTGWVDADDYFRFLTCEVPHSTGFAVNSTSHGRLNSTSRNIVRDTLGTDRLWEYSDYKKALPPCFRKTEDAEDVEEEEEEEE